MLTSACNGARRRLGFFPPLLSSLLLLEKNGVSLETIEDLLPVLDGAGALGIAGNNQQLLLNLLAPPLIELAPLLINPLAGLVRAGPTGFFGLSAALLGADAYLAVSDVQILNLPAAVLFGVLLVPVGAILGLAGAALGGAGKEVKVGRNL